MGNLSKKLCILSQTDLFQIDIYYLKMIKFDLIANKNKMPNPNGPKTCHLHITIIKAGSMSKKTVLFNLINHQPDAD